MLVSNNAMMIIDNNYSRTPIKLYIMNDTKY